MTGWPQLPPELRRMIFDWMKLGYDWESDPLVRIRYATVCREWQLVFEAETFKVLVLDQDRLPDFKRFVIGNERRRGHVRYMDLRVKLEQYDCTVCESPEDDATIERNDKIFVKTLFSLLNAMSRSRWKRPVGSDLSLDLGAYSPSDGQHTFRDFRFALDYPYIAGHKFRRNYKLYRRHALTLHNNHNPEDTCPGWINAGKGEPSLEAKRRALSLFADSRTAHYKRLFKPHRKGRRKLRTFPKVEAVTGLRIRRHYSRIISHGILSKLLEESLTNLRWLRHEKWHYLEEESQLYFTKGYRDLLYKSLPSTLKELHLFEEVSKKYYPDGFRAGPKAAASYILSISSCNVRKLSAFFLVDAMFFFPRIQPHTATWRRDIREAPLYPELERLALTSQSLRPKRYHRNATNMLVHAGVAALYRMPKLKVMEIWGSDERCSWLFRFTTTDKLEITWWSTWEADLSPVFEAWRSMALNGVGCASAADSLYQDGAYFKEKNPKSYASPQRIGVKA